MHFFQKEGKMDDGSLTIDMKLNQDGLKSGLNKIGMAKTGFKGIAVVVETVETAIEQEHRKLMLVF